MANFIVVRLLDVNYAPLAPKKTPTVGVNDGAAAPLRPTSQPGTFELQLPPDALRLELSIDEPGFWPFVQRLDVRAGTPPTVQWTGGLQDMSSRNLEVHSRGADFNLLVNFALGQLRDASPGVSATVAENPAALIQSPKEQKIRDFAASGPILVSGGRGWDRFAFKVTRETPDGTLFIGERQTAPKLIAAYVPAGTFARGKSGPVHYHVFFHPSSAHIPDPYPFGFQWIFLISRYVLHDRLNFGYAMANQHHVAGKRPVFVFPVGSPTKSFASMPTQAGLMRTLQELSYFLQRMSRVLYPQQTVGKVAVSGFSAGALHIKTLLETPFAPFDAHLREIYGLDLHLDTDAAVKATCDRLRAWLKGGADGRKLRLYTTKGSWFDGLRNLAPNPTVTTFNPGATEEDTPFSTILSTSYFSFWRDMQREVVLDPALGGWDTLPADEYDHIHHLLPELFMQHAIRTSTFAD